MPTGPVKVKQRVVARVLRAIDQSGASVVVKIDDEGNIFLIPARPDEAALQDDGSQKNEWNEVLR
jgi:hypothetical protein